MQHRRLAGSAIRSALPPLQHITPPVPTHMLPAFELEFSCAGRPFVAFVRARNSTAAKAEAELELAVQCPDFDPASARLVATRQVL